MVIIIKIIMIIIASDNAGEREEDRYLYKISDSVFNCFKFQLKNLIA